MLFTLFAIEWNDVGMAAVMVGVLMGILLVPYLWKEIRQGKGALGPMRRLSKEGVQIGPQTPLGTGDINPGRHGDPAPGMPDGQADPYGERARRHAPPIRS